MPVITASLGALPARFRRQRVLIVGCGDIGERVAALLVGRVQVAALARSPERQAHLRTLGIQAFFGDLDRARSLARLAGWAHRVLHLAPPPSAGLEDLRTRGLLRVLSKRKPPRTLIYASTSGVYGDCAGDWISETQSLNPGTSRAVRRFSAERHVRGWGKAVGTTVSILRVPGIYGADREGGTPKARLLNRTPVLAAPDDVYTNHIHANDLARACLRALWLGRAQRVYNVNDDTCLKMGDYMDMAADLYGLERPPRQSRSAIQASLTPMQFSFMGESRRMHNARMKRELRLCLRYSTVLQGLAVPS